MRCELSDLDETMCGCRLHKPETKEQVGYSFIAKFNGKCAECQEPTLEGETITKSSIGYVHEECS